MKKVLLLLVLAAGVLIGYKAYTSGSIPFLGSGGSDEERAVARLEEEFDAAVARYERAARAAGLSGIDTTNDAEAARLEAERVRRELGRLEAKLREDGAKDRARRLRGRIVEFTGS